MNAKGTAYVLQWEKEILPEFIDAPILKDLPAKESAIETQWQTLFISGGRKDKISKGDIAGLFFKQGQLQKDELGQIELKQDCAFVAVIKDKVEEVIAQTNNTRLKKKKVRVTLI